MRRITVVMCLMLILAFALTVTAEDAPWFDMENCSFCSDMDQEMMMKLGWEHYNIENGSMTVSTIPREYTEEWEKVRAGWKAKGEKMMAGEKMPLCGMCTAMGGLMMKGVKSEEVKWSMGYISLMTSDDPAIVKEVHAFTDKTNAELDKMMEAEMTEGMGH
ncbi:MAG: hypothetical protein P1R58_08350 [bacterium]|nr:hypothetical protein [bacterium]